MIYKEWDSKVLGLITGQMETIHDLQFIHNYEYVYIKVPSCHLSIVQRLETSGFKIADISQRFYILPFSSYLGEPLANPRLYKEGDLDQILDLTDSFYLDRFHRDYYLNKEQADRAYREWVTNACFGKYGDAVFVEETDGKVEGFSVCRITGPKSGSIDLTTVEVLSKSNGLLAKDIAFFRNREIEFVETSTQIDNIASRSSLKRLGFTELDSYITMSWRKIDAI